jgi:serine/threonine-protein kinase HipA
MNKKNQLSIRVKGIPVGILEQTKQGKIIFTYDEQAHQAISLAMPIRKEPYDKNQTEAYFAGLLPESEMVKKIIGKKYGISPNNPFALLKAIGYDCAGAISCHEMDDPVVAQSTQTINGRIISENELYEHIQELPKRPLFLEVDGLRLSLAGVQDKAAVCLVDDQIALAEQGCPTTHIIKPASSYFEGLVENEYFCLRIAKSLGLPVPDLRLYKIKDITFMLIERYDRKISNNQIERIHQEDFCQALGVLSSKKYQNEGGPSFKDCFELLKTTSQPAVDLNQLVAGLVFNYLIGNMDAHAKNFSLLHHSQHNIRLAPFYDMVCTRVYPELSKKMAMKIGGEYEAEKVLVKHWKQLCQDVQYRYIAMKDTLLEQAELVLNLVQIERKNFLLSDQLHIIDRIISLIEMNVRRIQLRFKEEI